MEIEKFIAEGRIFKDRESSTAFLNELGSAAVGYFNPKYFEELVSSILEEDPDANLVLLDDFRILVVDKIRKDKL